MKRIDDKDKVLFKNTIMLYILQFSSYLFSFITVPYQTRVLGPVVYGVLGVAAATMAYFQLFMDFGFMLSATEDISLNREDKVFVSKKLTSIAMIKVCFATISVLIIFALTLFIEPFSKYKSLYIVYVLAFVMQSFLPDYFFRGIEKMSAVTIRTVAVKFFCCVMTFVFLRTEEDYLVVPILLLIGNIGAVVWAYAYIYKTLNYSFQKVTFAEIIHDLKRSAIFFLSRIASTVYSATNTVIMGFIDKTGISTGYFTSADKIISTAKGAIAPISDSFYPYMVKHKNFKMIARVLLVVEPVILLGCIVVGIFAEPICIIAFGKEFAGAAPVLKAFLPVVVVLLPSYILGFPTLSAMNLSKYANYSIFFGTAVHLIGIVILVATSSISAITLATLSAISETAIMLFRLITVIKHRNVFKQKSIE